MAMGSAQMNSMLLSANTLKRVSDLSATKTQINGQSRILAAEIKMDKGRGLDTKKKEENLEESKARQQAVEENISGSFAEINERIETDREKIREEEAEQERQEKKTADSQKGTAVPGISVPLDTVEISPEAKAAMGVEASGQMPQSAPPATATVAPAAAPSVTSSAAPSSVPSTGKVVDIKL